LNHINFVTQSRTSIISNLLVNPKYLHYPIFIAGKFFNFCHLISIFTKHILTLMAPLVGRHNAKVFHLLVHRAATARWGHCRDFYYINCTGWRYILRYIRLLDDAVLEVIWTIRPIRPIKPIIVHHLVLFLKDESEDIINMSKLLLVLLQF
jgi:hypothetical protein